MVTFDSNRNRVVWLDFVLAPIPGQMLDAARQRAFYSFSDLEEGSIVVVVVVMLECCNLSSPRQWMATLRTEDAA
jgi:hypothetical protein